MELFLLCTGVKKDKTVEDTYMNNENRDMANSPIQCRALSSLTNAIAPGSDSESTGQVGCG